MIRVTSLVAHHWALPTPAHSAAGTWSERRALLIALEDEAGHVGLGEAAPLPGYSRDTLEEAHASLSTLLGAELRVHADAPKPTDVRAALGEASARLTSLAARSALEAALLDLWARRQGVPAWRLVAPGAAPERVPVATWLPDGADAAVKAARAAELRGVRAFKVKLDARRSVGNGVGTLVALREALGRDVTLRADANQSLTLGDLEPYLATLRSLGLEWLEEPTATPLLKSLGVPIALDESLVGLELPALEGCPDVAALVLKPTALGGLARCLELAAHARAHGRAVVASHTLDGPIGFMTAATLALSVEQRAAHGLGPYGRLRGDAFCPALRPERDELVAWSAPGFGLGPKEALAGAIVDGTDRP
jgi:o-succinylbenzoate synthase